MTFSYHMQIGIITLKQKSSLEYNKAKVKPAPWLRNSATKNLTKMYVMYTRSHAQKSHVQGDLLVVMPNVQ